MPKQTAIIAKRKKFLEIEIPIIKSNIEIVANSLDEIKDKTIKLDLTRQLKGKSIEATLKINVEDKKATAFPVRLELMPYFIRRMIRKKISYVEDSFDVKSLESLLRVKPFLITRKKVSRAVRKALRNRTKNWLEDYISTRKNSEIFDEILTNKLQKSLSLVLKKTYPLSLCEMRVLEIKRSLSQEEIPKLKSKSIKIDSEKKEFIDQLEEIEEEKIKEAEKEIKKTQQKAIEKEEEIEDLEKEESTDEESKKKTKKTRKKEIKTEK